MWNNISVLRRASEEFTWDPDIWGDKENVADALLDQDKRWRRRIGGVLTLVQRPSLFSGRRISAQFGPDHSFTLRNDPSLFHTIFAYGVLLFCVAYEILLFQIVLNPMPACGVGACAHSVGEWIALACAPVVAFIALYAFYGLDFVLSRGLFIRLSREIRALKGLQIRNTA